jgi:hypothetical protein
MGTDGIGTVDLQDDDRSDSGLFRADYRIEIT